MTSAFKSPFRSVALMMFATSVAHATGGGFQAGHLYLHSAAVTGSGSANGALVEIDPVTGQASILINNFSTPSYAGTVAYDRFRDRVLFCSEIGSAQTPIRLNATDALGNTESLGFDNDIVHALAPTGDGRVYLRRIAMPAGQIAFIDAANALHVLQDSSGTQPFVLTGGGPVDYRLMLYHAPTNSLIVASGPNGLNTCGGAPAVGIMIRRVPLSADGTRVQGSVLCNEFDVSTSGETVVGLSYMSNGHAMLVVDTNSNSAEPRMVEIDPITLAMTPYASNGNYTGAAATNAGTFSTALGKAVILDTFLDKLRAYALGESGNGTIIPSTIPLSSVGGSGESATLIEIDPSNCLGALHGYGHGKAGKGGIVPTHFAQGCPLPGATLTISIGSTVGGASGVLLLGTTPSSLQFIGGTLLVLPIQLTVPLTMPGAAGVAGAGSVAFPAVLPSDPALSGLHLYTQCVFSDAAALFGVCSTAGLEIAIG